MTIEEIQSICNKFPQVTADIKWETHLCFCVGAKIFVITSPDTSPVTASFKVNDADFAELSEKEGCMPAPYLARYKWIYVDDISRMGKNQWEIYLKRAYNLIVCKFPAVTKREWDYKVNPFSFQEWVAPMYESMIIFF